MVFTSRRDDFPLQHNSARILIALSNLKLVGRQIKDLSEPLYSCLVAFDVDCVRSDSLR